VKKTKVQLELKIVREVKDSMQGFCQYLGSLKED